MLFSLRHLYRLVATSPVKLLGLAFLLILMLFPQDGGPNKNARMASLAALITDHSFAITNYPWTEDWAISPTNGQKYANKPPGPVILAFPAYILIDRLAFLNPASTEARRRQLFLDRNTYSHVLSLLLQALPYALVTLLIAKWLKEQHVPDVAIHFGTLTILFGTTAALFMNSYFGHGMAALFVLAATYSLLRRQYTACGFLLGWAALSDYGAVLLIVPFMLSVIIQFGGQGSFKALRRLVAGALLPALIWCAYHWVIFGHPLAIASRFSNPVFLHTSARYTVWGLFSPAINFGFLRALLFGSERGLLFTQPWVLVTSILSLAFLAKKKQVHKDFLALVVLALGGLGVLLFVNSSFSGWHGGFTPGPRYLSSILPVFGIVASLAYAKASRFVRGMLWLTLLISLFLFITVYATTILAQSGSVWLFYWNIFKDASSIKPVVNLITAAAILISFSLSSMKKFLPTHFF